MSDKLNILSVNMNCSNYKLISLLNTASADCLLVQEPWWGSLVPHQSDMDPGGEASFGTVNHPHWSTFTPPLSSSPDGQPWVITFIRKRLLSSCSITPIPDLSHYDILGVSLHTPTFNLQLINFYHHVQCHHGNLSHLFDSLPDASSPVILAGDFNTHFDTWSPGGKKISP
jgi:hypothetical protein